MRPIGQMELVPDSSFGNECCDGLGVELASGLRRLRRI